MLYCHHEVSVVVERPAEFYGKTVQHFSLV